MDYCRGSLRRDAYARLALLSIKTPYEQDDTNIRRLVAALPEHVGASSTTKLDGDLDIIAAGSRKRLSVRELEVLLALCTAAAKLEDYTHAERAVKQLGPYLPGAHLHSLIPSPYLQEIKPSPWSVMSESLTHALLSLARSFAEVRGQVKNYIKQYIANWTAAAQILSEEIIEERDERENEIIAIEAAAVAVSMIGFLEAATRHHDVWEPLERLDLIKSIRSALSEQFMVALEKTISTIRHTDCNELLVRDWKRSLRQYAAKGTPLGAMLLQQALIKMVLACSSRFVCGGKEAHCISLLRDYGQGRHLNRRHAEEINDDMLEYLVDLVKDQMNVLEDGSDYLQLSSTWQKRLAFHVKAYCLQTYVNCMVLDEDIADAEDLLSWLEDAVESAPQMQDDLLASTVLQSLAVVPRFLADSATNVARVLLKFVVQSTAQSEAVIVAGESLAHILQTLSSDAIITTLYSLGNVLSSQQTGNDKQASALAPLNMNGYHDSISANGKVGPTGSVISLSMSGDEETSIICGNVARAIVTVATTSTDAKTIALAQTLLLQKLSRISVLVDAQIVEHSARLAPFGKENEFRSLLRQYSRVNDEAIHKNNALLLNAIDQAREYLASHLSVESALLRIFAVHLLEHILSRGDVNEGEYKRVDEAEMISKQIAPSLKPLAILAARRPVNGIEGESEQRIEIESLARDAWFNIVVHGISADSRIGISHHHELRVLAMHSMPLLAHDRAELLEADIELNTVLRRGESSSRLAEQRRLLLKVIPHCERYIKDLNYQKTVFLNTVYFVESLRAQSGSCAEILAYFADPVLATSDMGACLNGIAIQVINNYVQRARSGKDEDFTAPLVAKQLARILSACCHRSAKMQDVARAAADTIVSFMPSALIQKSSLFALLELLSIMWSSCLEAEIEEYQWRSKYYSERGKVSVELSDDHATRQKTLDALVREARIWLTTVIAIAPLDIKGLLQTYLSEYDDTGAYGHVSLGRSLALEMGSSIPTTDQRLNVMRQAEESARANVASDFMAQYTTRQEYRFGGVAHQHLYNEPPFAPHRINSDRDSTSADVIDEAQTTLAEIEHRMDRHGKIDVEEVKGVLRKAAALLCRSKVAQTAIVNYLVSIPFEIFTKESIKMGISLWLGVIHENSRMEARILTEVVRAWEATIGRELGIFDPEFRNPDPFYLKEEFAPSDREAVLKQARIAQDTISPHLRLLQFLESHFHAIRLGSVNTQRTFIRMIFRTLEGFRDTHGHPLMREIYFHTILFALQVLQYSTCLSRTTIWRLKESVLSTGLRWFAFAPAWSFGGNRLQARAEVKVMQDVLSMLASTRSFGAIAPDNRSDNNRRLALLETLIYSEIYRLNVWLSPLGKSAITSPSTITSTNILDAWLESPSLAIQLATRFPSDQSQHDVRRLLLKSPERAIHEPNAVDVLLDNELSSDLSLQLKYLLVWAPVNPVQAVTYFTPAYKNNAFCVQYGMRALESHSIDITFFYVPQIVQALRYDALGYVERFIVEAGKLSQLFAHQILWNMKANAYKDDDATIEDALKPTLDKVTDRLIASFTGEDKDFYEREFSFFGEVTDVSGKLKPFIKKSKPEKKAKIEEELRKIKVEVGVYLPSNPDGVVVGIDRKSGKPLQSHAKAPYMATFRIRKNTDRTTKQQAEAMSNVRPSHVRQKSRASIRATAEAQDGNTDSAHSYEVWQSAIFKVGDDCRQDVLALQLIAAFRGIFNSVGLDVYVYPYRVTATAPGCGVIDVLPNSISRDMLGREAVNGLYDYFVTKYGGEHSVRYQEARSEFVKSMAGYSVISYLMQFKDRHNGNIMIDDKGHILHIDFGFLFDISPGGVRFERAPFKLTPEMLAVMGGADTEKSQAYRWFEELTVKAFLASRQYCGKLLHLVSLMYDSGLPCFKPHTMQNMRDRFMLHLSEAEAARFMVGCIKTSAGNLSTMVYDEFQLLTNGIPY